jgi:hypothetical protein
MGRMGVSEVSVFLSSHNLKEGKTAPSEIQIPLGGMSKKQHGCGNLPLRVEGFSQGLESLAQAVKIRLNQDRRMCRPGDHAHSCLKNPYFRKFATNAGN